MLVVSQTIKNYEARTEDGKQDPDTVHIRAAIYLLSTVFSTATDGHRQFVVLVGWRQNDWLVVLQFVASAPLAVDGRAGARWKENTG
jgi:hypothetical protein